MLLLAAVAVTLVLVLSGGGQQAAASSSTAEPPASPSPAPAPRKPSPPPAAAGAQAPVGTAVEPAASAPEPASSAAEDPPPSAPAPDDAVGPSAPPLPGELLAEAEASYRRAAQHWNTAMSAWSAGESRTFQGAVEEAATAFDELSVKIGPCMRWLDEAKRQGWELPEAYARLRDRAAVWDQLREQVAKHRPGK